MGRRGACAAGAQTRNGVRMKRQPSFCATAAVWSQNYLSRYGHHCDQRKVAALLAYVRAEEAALCADPTGSIALLPGRWLCRQATAALMNACSRPHHVPSCPAPALHPAAALPGWAAPGMLRLRWRWCKAPLTLLSWQPPPSPQPPDPWESTCASCGRTCTNIKTRSASGRPPRERHQQRRAAARTQAQASGRRGRRCGAGCAQRAGPSPCTRAFPKPTIPAFPLQQRSARSGSWTNTLRPSS